MKAVVTRVLSASVTIDGNIYSEINRGYLILLGVAPEDTEKDAVDALLESVDLASYGLERVKLNHSIDLQAKEGELSPQNPNPRGAHNVDEEKDALDNIIRHFNERWFQGWSATPEEQRVKFVSLTESIKSHPDFKMKYQEESDAQNRRLAFERILNDIMLDRRRNDLEFYRLFASDAAFKASLGQSLQNVLG